MILKEFIPLFFIIFTGLTFMYVNRFYFPEYAEFTSKEKKLFCFFKRISIIYWMALIEW